MALGNPQSRCRGVERQSPMEHVENADRLILLATPAVDLRESFAQAVSRGLSSRPKTLPCRFLYDEIGSRLFSRVTELEEYYPTRAEREILETRSKELASRFPPETTLVELGSGSSDKTRRILRAFLLQRDSLRYVPIDISRVELERTAYSLLDEFSSLELLALAGEYRPALQFLSHRREFQGPKLLLWLGSSIGNFERPEAVRFLREVRATLRGEDRLLVGIDLRKDRETLEQAYDDPAGVTAAFNQNLLARINRELDGRFDVHAFRHKAVWEEDRGRVALFLVSLRAQRVMVNALDTEFSFTANEPIHTENSYKYSLVEIEALVDRAGFFLEEQWLDGSAQFSLNLFAPAGA